MGYQIPNTIIVPDSYPLLRMDDLMHVDKKNIEKVLHLPIVTQYTPEKLNTQLNPKMDGTLQKKSCVS